MHCGILTRPPLYMRKNGRTSEHSDVAQQLAPPPQPEAGSQNWQGFLIKFCLLSCGQNEITQDLSTDEQSIKQHR